MILTLLIVSLILLATGVVFFIKRKGLLGWLFTLMAVFGLGLWVTVKILYPDVP